MTDYAKSFIARARRRDRHRNIMACVWLVALISLLSFAANAADMALAIDILECESSGLHLDKHGALNCNKAEPKGGDSCGIAQFQRATFEDFKARAGFPRGRWTNSVHQLRVMNWMLDHGYGNRWTCYRRLKK